MKRKNIQKEKSKSIILPHLHFNSTLFCSLLFWGILFLNVAKVRSLLLLVKYPLVRLHRSIYFSILTVDEFFPVLCHYDYTDVVNLLVYHLMEYVYISFV